MNALSIIYPLAGTISGGGWANSYFDAIRKDCISHAGSISSIAMALACIFIAFKFIKMYYDFVSDEQHGGFGGVRTWDLLRPIVILIIIGNFGAFLGAFDSICNAVSSSLVSNMNARTSAVDAKLEDELTRLANERNLSKKEIREKAEQEASRTTGIDNSEISEYRQQIQSLEGQYRPNPNIKRGDTQAEVDRKTNAANQQLLANLEANGELAEYLRITEAVKNHDARTDRAIDNYKMEKKVRKWIGDGGSFLGKIVAWLFNIFFVIMMAYADIMLCILAVFGPLTLSLSLLDPFKQAFSSWVGRYIEVSLWKPIASGLAWITLRAKSAIGVNLWKAYAYAGADLSASAKQGTILGALGAECLIIFAGIMAIFQTPSIANSILSIGSGTGEFGKSSTGATQGAATGAVTGAASAVGRGGQKLLKSVKPSVGKSSKV